MWPDDVNKIVRSIFKSRFDNTCFRTSHERIEYDKQVAKQKLDKYKDFRESFDYASLYPHVIKEWKDPLTPEERAKLNKQNHLEEIRNAGTEYSLG